MAEPEELNRSTLDRLSKQIAELTGRMEKANLAEFVAFYNRPWRLVYFNFLAGLSRGFGIAVGFTIVGAVFLYLLGKLAALNLPVIGHFIAEIARIVEMELAIP